MARALIVLFRESGAQSVRCLDAKGVQLGRALRTHFIFAADVASLMLGGDIENIGPTGKVARRHDSSSDDIRRYFDAVGVHDYIALQASLAQVHWYSAKDMRWFACDAADFSPSLLDQDRFIEILKFHAAQPIIDEYGRVS